MSYLSSVRGITSGSGFSSSLFFLALRVMRVVGGTYTALDFLVLLGLSSSGSASYSDSEDYSFFISYTRKIIIQRLIHAASNTNVHNPKIHDPSTLLYQFIYNPYYYMADNRSEDDEVLFGRQSTPLLL